MTTLLAACVRAGCFAALLTLAGCAVREAAAPVPADLSEGIAEQLMVMVADAAPAHFRPGAGGGGYVDNARRQRVLRIAQVATRAHGATVVGDWPMPSLGVHCVVVRLPAGTNRDAVARGLEADPGIAWVQPVQRFEVLARDDGDPYRDLQAGSRHLNLRAVHAVSTGRAVRIGVIDTGVDATHPDLAGQVESAQDFLGRAPRAAEFHGTAVAGVIAARAGNGVGIVGVAPAARVVPLRACRQTEPTAASATCTTFSLAMALQFALVDGLRVLNLSLSGPADRLLAQLIDKALAGGAIVVAPVDRRAADGGFPASHPGVVAVAGGAPPALDRTIVLAPGEQILTTAPGARWQYVSGDSFSAAHVSGVAALLLEHRPALDAPQFARLLAGPVDGDRTPVLDACLALRRMDARIRCDSSATPASARVPARPPS